MPNLTFIILTVLFCLPSLAQEASPAPKADVPKVRESQTPLFFVPDEKTLVIDGPRVTYDLQSSQGESLDLGNGIVFNNDSFQARVENNELHFTWDANLIQSGDLSIINEQGKEVWKRSLDSVGSWSFRNLTGQDAPQWKNDEKFRFCLRRQQERGYTSLCSQLYAVLINESGIQLGQTRSAAAARIIFQNEEMKLKGSEQVSPESPVQFLATLKTNASYEFLSVPSALVIRDLVEASEKEKVVLTGELPAPLKAQVAILSGEKYGKFTRFLGWEKTIAERKDLWQVTLSAKETSVSLPGKSGGVFIYKLTIKDPPTEKQRLFVNSSFRPGTYLSQDQFTFMDTEDNVKTWFYDAPDKFALNKVTLGATTEDSQAHKSYLEAYRGSAGEASLRLTGVGSTEGSFILLGEGHVAWWFNDLFGWQNNYLSKQRWGVSARYFSSLMDFPVSTSDGGSEDVSLNVLQADLRYRFDQGLWERDETVGLIAAYETVSMASDTVPKIGAGIFWARSMPRSIDSWLSKIPHMNSPKWVDMEFITFLSSPDTDIELKNDFVLNFHGKVLWTPTFFGEAGIGIKNYHYVRSSDESGAKLTTFYGTLGVGINF